MIRFLGMFAVAFMVGILGGMVHTHNTHSHIMDSEKTVGFKFKPFYTTVVDKENNTIYVGSVDGHLFKTISDETARILEEGGEEIILDFHSPGGSVKYMELIVIQLRLAKENGLKVTSRMVSGSLCASACPAIFIQGDTRVVHPHTVIMLHSPYVRGFDRLSEAEKEYHRRGLQLSREYYAGLFVEVCKNDWVVKNVSGKTDNFFYSSAVAKHCKGFYTDYSQKAYPIYLPAFGITERTVDVAK